MNKYLRKARDRMLDCLAGALGDEAAIDLYKLLSRRFRIDGVAVTGPLGRIEGAPVDLVMGSYIRERTYGDGLIGLVTDHLLKDGTGTFIDIGANIGLISVPVARATTADIHAFEPEPRNFGYLSRNAASCLPEGRVTLHNLAVSDSDGMLRFELSGDNFGDHRVRRDGRTGRDRFNETEREVIEVAGVRLDSVLDATKLAHPLVIKIDTQGSEIAAFRGGATLFAAADYVLAEYCPYMLLRSGHDPAEFMDFVRGFPRAAVIGDSGRQSPELEPSDAAVAKLETLPSDGSSVRHMDVLLART